MLKFSDLGVFVCKAALQVVDYYYETLKGNIVMEKLEAVIQESVNLSSVDILRKQMVYLLKELNKIQVCNARRKNDEVQQSLQNYVEMSHVVDKSKKYNTVWLNRISTIEKYSKIRDFIKTISIEEIDNLNLIKHAFGKKKYDLKYNAVINDYHPAIKKLAGNQLALHPDIIGDYFSQDKSNIIMTSFTDKLKDDFIKHHLRKMSDAERSVFQIESWTENIYGKIGSNLEDAKVLVLSHHLQDIEDLKDRIVQENRNYRNKLAKNEAVSLRVYNDLVIQLLLLVDYVSETPFLHPADSIIAVTKYSNDSYGVVVDQSHLHLQNFDSNKIIVKTADRQFIEDNFLQTFISEVERTFDDSCSPREKWVVQKSNSKNMEHKSDIIKHDVLMLNNIEQVEENVHCGTIQAIKRKNPMDNNVSKILWIRVSFIPENSDADNNKGMNELMQNVQLKNTVRLHKFRWHVYCESDLREDGLHLYESVSESSLSEIVSSSMLSNWKIESLALFQFIVNDELNEKMYIDDKKDVHYTDVTESRGKIGFVNAFYFLVEEKQFYYTLCNIQLSKFLYDYKENVFYGLAADDFSENNKQEVSPEWIKKNFGQSFHDHLKLQSKHDVIHFIKVPPGNVQPIHEMFCNTDNPPIRYLQEQERTCAFSSLASILCYFNYFETADLIASKRQEYLDSFGNEFLHHNKIIQNKNPKLFPKRKKRKCIMDIPKPSIFLDWLPFIAHYMQGSSHNHHYQWKKVNKNFNIFQQINSMKDNEFVLGGLKAIDNSIDHAICISRNYIFDSNAKNAIDFSKEALDACCQSGFHCIHKGYYFHKREDEPKLW